MAEEIPVIPKVKTLIVRSGNIVNWNILKRKPNQGPSEELVECISNSMKKHISEADKNCLQCAESLDCTHSEFKKNLSIDNEERGDYKLTVKIFLCRNLLPGSVKEAVEKVKSELSSGFVETVLLAFPELDDNGITLDQIETYWRELEELHEAGTVLAIGVSDLDKTVLEELYNWAKVKPTINQVNLASCCVMPKDLTEYAKEKDIQLLTHNDPRDILTGAQLTELVSASCHTEKDGEGWEPDWAVRYSVIIKCRGIIKTKGYIIKATRDTTKRKSQQQMLY